MLDQNQITTINNAQEALDTDTMLVATDILQESDAKKLKDLTQLFNLQHTKKQIIRTLQYDKLLDNITNQIEERVSKRADQFSNKELLDYMNMMTTSLEKAQKQISTVNDAPLITINQQTNNTVVVEEGLSRESRRKVLNIVDAILAKVNTQEPQEYSTPTVYNTEDNIDLINDETDQEIQFIDEEDV